MASLRFGPIRTLLAFLFVLSSMAASVGGTQGQDATGEWADDGCYYEWSEDGWILVGCAQPAVDGSTLFVSVEITGDDGFRYYYEYNYNTGVTTWYTYVTYPDGTSTWLNYDEFLQMQSGESADGGECGVMPAGQPGSECEASTAGTESACGVMPAGQPGSPCEAPTDGDVFDEEAATEVTGAWADDGCYYLASEVRDGCLQYTDSGSPIYVSVEIAGGDGFRYYYSYEYDTGITTWYTHVTDADGTGYWMNYDEFLQLETGTTAETGNPCGVMPAGQPGSECEAPYVAPDSTAWNVDTLTQYVYANLDSYWAEWFTSQGYQYASPTYVVGSNLSTTACLGDSYGPFYCSGDYGMYLDEPWLDDKMIDPGDFAVAIVIAHEFGHHVETQLGLDRSDSVRYELVADCFAGVWANTAYYQGILDDDDIDEAITVLWTLGDDYLGIPVDQYGHGTSEQRQASFLVGYNTGDAARC